jgi:phosphopantetheinyl transferase
LWELPLSLSHSGERALCATGPGRVGADIERIQARIPELVSDFFTRPEAALVEGAPASHRNELITLIWSAKEAVLKALRLGLTVDTRAVTCLPDLEAQSEWKPFSVRFDPHWFAGPALRGWWQTVEGYALTIVTERPHAAQAKSFLPRIRKLFGRQ